MVKILIGFLLVCSHSLWAKSPYEVRKEWVETLRVFIADIEERNPEYFISLKNPNLLDRLEFIAKAYADGEHSCFFAGWPSKVISSQGRKYCTSPVNGNADYKSSCSKSEFQCQPLLFGPNVCVTFKSSKDKSMAFANCTNKYSKTSSDEYLKTLSQSDKDALKRMSLLAKDICVDGKIGIQKNKPMCKNLLSRFDTAMKAIEETPVKEDVVVDVDEDKKEVTPITINPAPLVTPHIDLKPVTIPELKIPGVTDVTPEECVVPFAPEVDNVVKQTDEILKVVDASEDDLYEKMKEEFQKSPHCKPSNVYSDPKQKMSPALFQKIYEAITDLGNADFSPKYRNEIFQEMAKEYQWSDEVKKYGEEILLAQYSDDNIPYKMSQIGRLRGLALQNSDQLAKTVPDYMSDVIEANLVKRDIFVMEDGKAVCPFVSKDAFKKALAGHQELLKSANKSLITNPEQLTIVDLTAPSNQRRLYVLDLKTNKVLHNTWSAHGGGKGFTETEGSDLKGGSPTVSNEPGSNLSSVGFAIATKSSVSPTWGNSLIIKGVDEENTNMERRAIIMHGWRTPNSAYTSKTWEVDEKSLKRVPGKDIYKDFMSVNFKETKEDIFDLSYELKGASIMRPVMDATEGCFGVPETNMKHTDPKQRSMSQMDMLREDLPGSVIYQYNGESTPSKYY